MVLVIALVILLYTMQSLFTRMYTDNYPGNKNLTTPVFAVICGLIVTAVSFFFSGFSFSFSWLTVLLGVINAVVLYGYDAFMIKASASGPYSILMAFSLSGGIIVPAIVAWVTEEFYWMQLVSIAVILVSVLLICQKDDADENGEEFKKHRAFFLIICTLLGLANGTYGTLLSTQQVLTGVMEKEEMVVVTFMGAALISLVQLFVKEKKNALSAFKQTKLSLIFLISASLVSALAINALVIALEGVDQTVVYTFDNAGVLMLSAVASALFFKEKLSVKNIVGCVIMCLGLAAMTQSLNIQNFILSLFN